MSGSEQEAPLSERRTGLTSSMMVNENRPDLVVVRIESIEKLWIRILLINGETGAIMNINDGDTPWKDLGRGRAGWTDQ